MITIGGEGSFTLMMQAFLNFSDSTDLVANPAKCKIYFGCVPSNIQQKLMSWPSQDTLLVCYLLNIWVFLCLIENLVFNNVDFWSIELWERSNTGLQNFKLCWAPTAS